MDLVMPGPNGPFGDALVAAVREGRVSEAAVDDKVARLLRLAAARRRARRDAPTRRAPWSDAEIAAELRATAAASFVLARNHGTLLPLERALAAQGRRARAQRRRRAHAGRRVGDRLPALHGLAARRAAHRARARRGHLRARRAHPHAAAGRARSAPPTCASSPPTGRCSAPSTARSASSPGSARWTRTRAAIEVHTTLRATVAGEHVVGCSGAGRYQLELRRRGRPSTSSWRCARTPTPARRCSPRRSTGCRSRWQAGETLELVLRRDGRRPAHGHLPAQPRAAVRRGGRVRARRRARARGRRRDRGRRHDGGGRERGLRPRLRSRCPAARTSSCDASTRRSRAPSVVVNSGAPVLLPWLDEVPGVLLCWFPGQEAGNALADVLFGAAEPGGRLPMTWPASEDGLPSVTPVDGVLPYDEGLAIGYRGAGRAAAALRPRPRLHDLGLPGDGRRDRAADQLRHAPRARGDPGLRLAPRQRDRAPGALAGRLRRDRGRRRRGDRDRHPARAARVPALGRRLADRARRVRARGRAARSRTCGCGPSLWS